MAIVGLNSSQSRLDFFQQRIVHAVEHWNDHEAVQNVEVKVLDLKREAILRAIALGLEYEPAWLVVKRLIIAFTPYMERRGYWDAWHGVLEQAIGVAQEVDDVEAETTLTALLARLCQRMSKPDDVVYHYRRVIRLAKRTGNRFEEARACSNLGYLYIDRGQWWRSEVLSLHALAVFEELESEHGRAHTHNHLGVLHARQSHWKYAIEHLKIACSIWQNSGDKHSLLTGLINLALIYIEIDDPDQALMDLNNACIVAQSTGESSKMGRIWNNMANAHRLKQNWAEAGRLAIMAEERFKEYAEHQQLANVWHNLGLIRQGEGQISNALEYLEESLKMHEYLHNEVARTQVWEDMQNVVALSKDDKTTTESY